MPRKPAVPKVKPLLTRPEVIGLCKRWMKPGAYDPMRDMIVLYGLIKKYPSRAFWLAYTLDWQPDSLYYFVGANGRAKLESDWQVFNLDIPAQPAYALETAKVGEDVVINKKPRTIAELLKS
jgi:hypothetical protein